MSLALVRQAYGILLTPVPPFTWFGLSLSTLDVLAAIRLCAVMRQIRELMLHLYAEGKREERSFPRDYFVTFIVVYGGEALSASWLGFTPSFMLSPTYPLLYLGCQALIEFLPWIPPISFEIEGPLTFLDALTRSWLLTDLLPPAVLGHASPVISNSPWTLLLASSITANGGFFIVNLCSMLHPNGWSLTTPSEFKSYGWITVDLWAAPLITALSAILTHAQPSWTYLHLAYMNFLRPAASEGLDPDVVKPWDQEDVRALSAVILWVLFSARAVNNLGITWWKARMTKGPKKEVMRSRIDGRRYPGIKKKVQ